MDRGGQEHSKGEYILNKVLILLVLVVCMGWLE